MANLGNNTSLKDALSAIDSKVVQAEKDRNKLEAHLVEKGTELIPGSKMSVLIDKVPLVKGFPKGWDEEVVAEAYGSSIAEGDPVRKLTLPGFGEDMAPTSGLYNYASGGFRALAFGDGNLYASAYTESNIDEIVEFNREGGLFRQSKVKFYPPLETNYVVKQSSLIFQKGYVGFTEANGSNYFQIYKKAEDSYTRIIRESPFGRLCSGIAFNSDVSRVVVSRDSVNTNESPCRVYQRDSLGNYLRLVDIPYESGIYGVDSIAMNDDGNIFCIAGNMTAGGNIGFIIYEEDTAGKFKRNTTAVVSGVNNCVSCKFNKDHLIVVTGSEDSNRFVLYKISGGEVIRITSPLKGELPNFNQGYHINFTPSGKYLILYGEDNTFYLYEREGDIYNFINKSSLDLSVSVYWQYSFKCDEDTQGKPHMVIPGSNYGCYYYVWNGSQWKSHIPFSLSAGEVAAIDHNAEGIMVTGTSNRLSFYEERGDYYKTVEIPTNKPNANLSCIKFSPSGLYLAVTSSTASSCNIAIYKRESRGKYVKLSNVPTYPSKPVRDITWSDDERLIAVGHEYLSSIGAFSVYRRDGDLFTKLPAITNRSSNTLGIHFCKDNRTFVVFNLGSSNTYGQIYKISEDRTTMSKVSTSDTTIVAKVIPTGVVKHPTSDMFYVYGKVGTNGTSVEVVEFNNNTLTPKGNAGIETGNKPIKHLAMSPDGGYLATTLESKELVMYKKGSDLSYTIIGNLGNIGDVVTSVFSNRGNLTLGGKRTPGTLLATSMLSINATVKDIITRYDYKVPINKGMKVGVALESKNAGEQIKANLFPKIGLL